MTPRKLTTEEINGLGRQYQKLMVKAHTQLAEHQGYLKQAMLNSKMNAGQRNRLMQEIDEMAISYCTVSESKVTSGVEVSLLYTYPDDLHAFLNQDDADLPELLRDGNAGLQGGRLLPATKPGMVDLMPQTGKTQAGVRGH